MIEKNWYIRKERRSKKMMQRQKRKCSFCEYPIICCLISDNEKGWVELFLAIMTSGPLKNMQDATDTCPNCGKKLSLETTTEVKEKK